MKKIICTITIILAIGIISCKKDISSKENQKGLIQNPINNKRISTIDVDYKNNLNPYDNIGQIHNTGLDYLFSTYNTWSSPIDSSLVNGARDYGVNTLGYSYSSVNASIYTSYNSINSYMANNNDQFDQAVYNMINDWSGSIGAKNYMHSLFQSVFEYTDINNASALITTIKGIEINITNDSSISSNDKESLYRVASVLRYSIYYWDSKTPTVWPNNAVPTWWKKVKAWLEDHPQVKVACADAAVLILQPTPWGVVSAFCASIASF